MLKKVLIVSAILIFYSFKSNAQVFDFYRAEVSVAYLPSYGRQSEVIEKVNNQISHRGILTIWKHKKSRKKKLKPNYLIEDQIRQLDSLFKVKSFTFKINSNLIDSLKQSTFWKDTYNITDQDIDSFFTRQDTVTLDINDIHISEVDLLSGVLDGIPYYIRIRYKRADKDTVDLAIEGNLYDGVNSLNIAHWLPFYLVNREHPIFSSIAGLNNYFGDERLQNILLRFISWKKTNRFGTESHLLHLQSGISPGM
ncbi:hypothetical protein [Arcticibacter tournemirensis]|uniref:Uncharacterized protein n=1 Tax=Arcticibacter tournemirensis TaxID=699437 RepID=A0A4Q0MHC3_9SPHI|nr:hypothetical protein [Arcticibacter tournemirensis]RXF72386.1 hypothetical protein EKH83_01265 [Arcticibacter tournemirensis]